MCNNSQQKQFPEAACGRKFTGKNKTKNYADKIGLQIKLCEYFTELNWASANHVTSFFPHGSCAGTLLAIQFHDRRI